MKLARFLLKISLFACFAEIQHGFAEFSREFREAAKSRSVSSLLHSLDLRADPEDTPTMLYAITGANGEPLQPCLTATHTHTPRRARVHTARTVSLPAPPPVAAIPLNANTPSSHTSSRVHGAGFIACNLIKTLVANGHTVRGTVRDVAKDGAHLTSLGATVAEVKDLTNEEALAKALAGVDGVFHMAAVHPEYGFADTPEGRTSMLATAVEGTVAVLSACQKAGVKRVVLTSSLAAIECGNDEGTLSELMWSKAEVYDSEEKLKQTQWATHYTYVKSKVSPGPDHWP